MINMVRLAINLFGALFELYLIIFFVSFLMEKRPIHKAIRHAIYFISLMLLTISGQLTGSPFSPSLAFMAVFILINIYMAKLVTKLILSLIVFSIFLIAEIMTGMLLISTDKISIEDTINDMFIYMCAIVMSKFIVYLIIQFIKEKVAMYKFQKPKFAYYILIMPLSSAFVIYLLFLLTYDIKSSRMIFAVVLAVILLVLANISTLYIIDRLLEYESNKEKLQYMQKQFQVQEEHYKELEQKQYEINAFYHNMKNYLLAVKGYIDDGEYDKATEKIRQANEILNIESLNMIKTGNTGLDALINAKIIRMQNSDIEFDYNVKIPNSLSIDYIDLCIIIGNALDNAIEACENICNEARKISLTCIQTGNYISIVISNTISKLIKTYKGQELITTKKNKNLHGFGLRSIRHIAEKNKGNVIIEQEDNQFTIKIILFNELV